MKKVVSVLSILAIIAFSVSMVGCSNAQKPEKVLRHVVMFGFKPDVSEAQVKEVEDAFSKLPSQIDLIKGYEWGTDCSPEGLQQGLTHCFFLTFHSDADRDAYLVHPAHKGIWQGVRREGIGGYGVGLLDEIKRMGGMNQ